MTETASSDAPHAAFGSKGWVLAPAGGTGRPYAASPWHYWAMTLAFEAAMAPTLVSPALQGRWSTIALIVLVMTSVLSPVATRQWRQLKLPVPLEMALVAFFFSALFLGEVEDFYERLPWWDMALHTSSGVLFSATGLLLAYCLERQHGRIDLAPRVAFLFAPMFAMSIGTVWEIFEFALQSLSGLPIQVPQMSDWSGVSDTMWDMIMNAGGAILVAAYGWHRFRPGSAPAVPGWVARFLAENPRLLAARP